MIWQTGSVGNPDMQSVLLEPQTTQTLPPLILHPFADASGPGKLLESSRASLMLQGLLPTGDYSAEQLEERLLDGRYCEIRMLFYVGRDLVRWVEQSLEYIGSHDELQRRGYTFASLVSYLIRRTPALVQAKLRKWGVADYRSIFSRAIALNQIFAELPDRATLSNEFVRNYYRYTDMIFGAVLKGDIREVDCRDIDFELYASGEYSRMLEREWGQISTEG
jgi:hypothetical protein